MKLSYVLSLFFTIISGQTMPLLNSNNSYIEIVMEDIPITRPVLWLDDDESTSSLYINQSGTNSFTSYSNDFNYLTIDKSFTDDYGLKYDISYISITGFTLYYSLDFFSILSGFASDFSTTNIFLGGSFHNYDNEDLILFYFDKVSLQDMYDWSSALSTESDDIFEMYYTVTFDDNKHIIIYEENAFTNTEFIIGFVNSDNSNQYFDGFNLYLPITYIADVSYRVPINKVNQINEQLINNYNLGYDKGLDDGSPTINEFGITDIMEPITTTFDSFINFFDINLFGNFKLGYLFFIPLIFTALMFILKVVVK